MALMLIAGVFTSCSNDGSQGGGTEQEPEKPVDNNKCTVIFDKNNGSDWAVSQESVTKGGFVKKPENNPYLEGFLFRGWYADGSDEEFDFGTPITSNIRLTAKWTKIPDYLKVGNGYVSGYVAEKLPTDGIIEIPEGITSIGQYAFYECTSLTGVTIPNTVTRIGDYAFKKCTNLTDMTIPDSVTYIGMQAFLECTSLESVTIGKGVSKIEDGAFSNCTRLTSVTIGKGVTEIGSSAFSSCTSLASVTIPDGVTTIGYFAFLLCTKLTDVTIPDSVTEIKGMAFSSCESLTSVTYGGTETEWKRIYRSQSDNTYADGLPGKTIIGKDGSTWTAATYTSGK